MAAEHPKPWKVLSSSYVLKTPWMDVRRDECELPDGSVIDDYFVVERAEVAGIVAITEDGQVVLNRQYKHGIGEVVLEVPAGMVDEGEEPIDAARRELEEETGYLAEELIHVHTLIASPSNANNRFHIFLAPNVKPGGKKDGHPREEIVNCLIPAGDIWQRVIGGDLTVMWSVAALSLALEKYQEYGGK